MTASRILEFPVRGVGAPPRQDAARLHRASPRPATIAAVSP